MYYCYNLDRDVWEMDRGRKQGFCFANFVVSSVDHGTCNRSTDKVDNSLDALLGS